MLVCFAPLAGCAAVAVSTAATAVMALGGATAMEMNANDMMPRVHEENAAYIDEAFNPGPLAGHSPGLDNMNSTADGRLPATPTLPRMEEDRQDYALLPEFPSARALPVFPAVNRAAASPKSNNTAGPAQAEPEHTPQKTKYNKVSLENPPTTHPKPAAADSKGRKAPPEEGSRKQKFQYTPIEEQLYPGF